jgi:dephospho-CoA kinase
MVIGITGPAGSGKSTVAHFIKKLLLKNVQIVEVDRIGHQVLTLFFVQEELREVFGEEIFDENHILSRKKLGNIVFKDKEKLEILNKIVHPEIFKKTKEILNKSLKKSDIIILDAALLYKIGLHILCDKVIFIDAPKEIRIKRLTESRKIPYQKAKSIVDSQEGEYFGPYDFIICHDNGFEKLEKQIREILKNLGYLKDA